MGMESTKKPVIANEVKQSPADQWEIASAQTTGLAMTRAVLSSDLATAAGALVLAAALT